MAIKLNWKDLAKRIINGREVGRVVLNGVQIWPTSTPPTPVYTPWIYWDEANWLISASSDWTNWVTMADKNVWATQVRERGDTITPSNGGNLYQWWNNYWFPMENATNTSWDTVDTTWYGPTNPYSSSTFILTYDNDWSEPTNNNLRWNDTWTLEARQWPCPSWFHVPTELEREKVLWVGGWRIRYPEFLKIPNVWYLDRETWQYMQNYLIRLWTSQPWPSYDRLTATLVELWTVEWGRIWHYPRGEGFPIRAFCNTVHVPDTTRTVLYQPSE